MASGRRLAKGGWPATAASLPVPESTGIVAVEYWSPASAAGESFLALLNAPFHSEHCECTQVGGGGNKSFLVHHDPNEPAKAQQAAQNIGLLISRRKSIGSLFLPPQPV